MIHKFAFLAGLLVVGCGDKQVEEASCSETALASLQETCVELGGDFTASTSASSADECGASGSVGTRGGGAGGSCSLKGEGACEIICDLPNTDDADADADSDADADADVDDGTDSDGDGWSDYEEEQSNTNPDFSWDHPYETGWPIDACRDDLVPTGNDRMELGDVVDALDWREYQVDDRSHRVRLHDFCDQVVILKYSVVDDLEDPLSTDDAVAGTSIHESTTEALSSATKLQGLYESRRSDGLMVITHMAVPDDEDVDQEHLEAWANDLGLTHPVVHSSYGGPSSFSGYGDHQDHIVIGRGGEILQINGDFAAARSVALDALAR